MADTTTSLRVQADLKNLSRIRSFMEEAAEKAGLSGERISGIRLAVDEACANIITHGYGDNDGEIDVRVTRDNESMIVTVRDDAPPYNPFEQAPSPDLDAPLAERPLGGMGVLLVKQHTDSVEYKAPESGGNALVMTMNLPGSEPE